MIREERLKELIEQEKDVWVHAENDVSVGCIHLNKKYQPELYENGLHNYILYVYANDKFEYKEEIFDDELYETKEEAEWVAQNWCEKKIVFQPPTFEEFEKTMYWKCENIVSIMKFETIDVFNNSEYEMSFYYDDKTTKQQAYYQAVEYAKRLFLRESE